jgi:hypothetical protein
MTDDRSSIERLREYLQALSPQARTMLVGELERGLLSDDAVAGSELVLQELRRIVRADAQPTRRINEAARRFFMPAEPFIVDDAAEHKRIGRLARVSLIPVWDWIGRDLMPAEAKALSDDIDRALLANNGVKTEQLVRALHERAIRHMKAAIAALETGENPLRRFAVEVGTPRAIEDVTTLTQILDLRSQLSELARRLPKRIAAFEAEEVDQVRSLLDTLAADKSLQNAQAQESDFLLYGLIAVMNRLSAPWQLIRVAIRAAASIDVERIAATPYGIAIILVLAELDTIAGELRAELKAGRPVTSLLKVFGDGARGLRGELDLTADSAASRQLTATRNAVSNLLSAELEAVPSLVRSLLRPRPPAEIVPGSVLDAGNVNEVAGQVELVEACRHFADELAVAEITQWTHSELRQYLETASKILLDALRHSGNAERPFRRSQVDAAVRVCRTIFGADYAGSLAKAAEAALRDAAIERRSALA